MKGMSLNRFVEIQKPKNNNVIFKTFVSPITKKAPSYLTN